MFIRSMLRWGLVGGLALGGVTLLVGPERVCAGFAMVRGKAQNVVDNLVDDPVALRRQLDGLAKQYPDRIAEVRGEIAEVEHQLVQFNRDVEIATRVVAMTSDDLNQLKTLVTRAEESVKSASYEPGSKPRPVFVRFEGVKFNIEEAYNEARRINTVRGTYQDRLAHDQQQIAFLDQQKGRLAEILNKLETEYNTFQAQLWQLDRQIDAIERNERLITLTEQQQATLASYEKFGKIGSLKQLEAKLAELRAVQEAQLDSLSKKGVHMDYENKATYDMDTNSAGDNPFEDVDAEPSTDDVEHNAPAASGSKSLAFLDPIVIEND